VLLERAELLTVLVERRVGGTGLLERMLDLDLMVRPSGYPIPQRD